MPQAHVNGTVVNYRRAGSGPDVVLVHGLAANHAFWRFDLLLPLARSYRVTTYDLKGHGYSGRTPDGYTAADLAGDLRALLDHLEIPRAHIVGHSFGGIVALHLATRWPERLASLAIIDSRVRVLQEDLRLDGWPDWAALQAVMTELGIAIPEDSAEPGIDALDRLADPAVRQRLEQAAQLDNFDGYVPFAGPRGGSRSAERWLHLVRTTSAGRDFRESAGLTREDIRGVACPTLALYGESSHCLESCRGLEALIANCRAVTVPRAGHYFPATRPDVVVAALEQFLASVGPRAPAVEERP